MSTILTFYIVAIVIGIIGMCVRAFMALQESTQQLRTIILLPALSCVVGVLYAYLLAEKAFDGFVALLRFGFFSDLLMYFIGLNILLAALSVPAIPWLLSSPVVRACIWGGVLCLCVALWVPFCQELAAVPK